MSKREEQSGLVLLIEDNRAISETVGEFLERRGYSVDYAADGVSGLRLATSNSYDVIVLDLMLPGMDGLDVCRRLRQEAKKSTPVLMLTARDTLEDKVTGLDAGADDYLVKPFEVKEMEARVRALIRRADNECAAQLVCGTLRMDTAALRAWLGDQELALTSREWTILEVLLRQLGQVISKKRITQAVKDWEQEVTPNTVEVHISRLRRKLGSTGPQIRAVRGFGYLLEDPDTRH